MTAPSFTAIPRGHTVEVPIYVPGESVGFEGPQSPPPPLPPPPTSLDPETGVNIFGGLGEDLPEPETHEDHAGQLWRPRSWCRHAVKAAFRQGLWIGALGAGFRF